MFFHRVLRKCSFARLYFVSFGDFLGTNPLALLGIPLGARMDLERTFVDSGVVFWAPLNSVVGACVSLGSTFRPNAQNMSENGSPQACCGSRASSGGEMDPPDPHHVVKT